MPKELKAYIGSTSMQDSKESESQKLFFFSPNHLLITVKFPESFVPILKASASFYFFTKLHQNQVFCCFSAFILPNGLRCPRSKNIRITCLHC